MIKTNKILSVLASVALTATMLASCGAGTGTINVISREDGSGTRGAFIELAGVEEKDADGNKTDKTTEEAQICKSTDVVLTQVSGDDNAIGYISLGSLNDTVKASKIDGVEPTVENVENGSYTIVRPFNIVVGSSLSDAAQDLQNFILSSEGQAIVEEKGYIPLNGTSAYESNGATGKVVVVGSSSVYPVMEKIAEAYQKANTGVTVEVQSLDSSTGIKSAIDGTCDIGMASRELKDTEIAEGVTGVEIAKDAIAVIINKNNEVNSLTIAQVKAIYTGEITAWADIK